jgi:hypothetical protein
MDGVMTDADGRRLGERLQVENAPAIVIWALQGPVMKLASAVAIMTLVLTPAHAVEPFGVATTPSQSAGLITLWLDLRTELAKDEVEITWFETMTAGSSSITERSPLWTVSLPTNTSL